MRLSDGVRMMNNRHRINQHNYCPYCLAPLTEVVATGHLFCNRSLINCGYEVNLGARAPLTFEQCQRALKLRYTQRVKSLERKKRDIQQQIVSLNRQIEDLEHAEAS